MPAETFEELRTYFSFGRQEVEDLKALGEQVRPQIPRIVARFYETLLEQPGARTVLLAEEGRLERLRVVLSEWLAELFAGVYDQSYYEKRRRIGFRHVEVGLPPRYMPLGMELIWQGLMESLRGKRSAGRARQLRSLHKLLMLDLTIMLQSYTESYSDQVRRLERRTMEEKLTRAEHLAGIGQLAAALAHEIKNPLAGISGAIQVIGSSLAPDDPHREVLGEILGQIKRLDATVKDLLLYARPAPPSVGAVELDKLLPRVLAVLREEPAMRGIRTVYDFRGADPTLVADEGQLQQLLMNLILNAAQASGDGAAVELRVEADGRWTTVTVRDGGTGMSVEVLEKAMDPFFTTKSQGTGLGLAICRRIAEAHGGSIFLQSAPGAGTTVTVRLPRRGTERGG